MSTPRFSQGAAPDHRPATEKWLTWRRERVLRSVIIRRSCGPVRVCPGRRGPTRPSRGDFRIHTEILLTFDAPGPAQAAPKSMIQFRVRARIVTDDVVPVFGCCAWFSGFRRAAVVPDVPGWAPAPIRSF